LSEEQAINKSSQSSVPKEFNALANLIIDPNEEKDDFKLNLFPET